MSRPPDTPYLDQGTPGGLPSWASPEAKHAELVLLKNVLFTVRTLHFFPQDTVGVKLEVFCFVPLQFAILRPLNKTFHLILAKPPDTFLLGGHLQRCPPSSPLT